MHAGFFTVPGIGHYSDYRTVNGVLMPFHVENYLAGQKIADITFSSVQANTGILDLAGRPESQEGSDLGPGSISHAGSKRP